MKNRITASIKNPIHLPAIIKAAETMIVNENGALIDTSTGIRIDRPARNSYPYLTIPLNENTVGVMTAHHMAWVITHGPDELATGKVIIDHKNRNKGDNRIGNLRLVTPTGNQLNKVNNLVHPYILHNGGRLYIRGYNQGDDPHRRWYSPVSREGAPMWSAKCVAAKLEDMAFPVPHLPKTVTLGMYRLGDKMETPFETYDRDKVLERFAPPFEATVAAIHHRSKRRNARINHGSLTKALRAAGSPENLARQLLLTSRHLPYPAQ